jgi:hypothetical protein
VLAEENAGAVLKIKATINMENKFIWTQIFFSLWRDGSSKKFTLRK